MRKLVELIIGQDLLQLVEPVGDIGPFPVFLELQEQGVDVLGEDF